MATFEVSIQTGTYTVQAPTDVEAISTALRQAIKESVKHNLHAGILDWVSIREIPEP